MGQQLSLELKNCVEHNYSLDRTPRVLEDSRKVGWGGGGVPAHCNQEVNASFYEPRETNKLQGFEY